MPLTIYLIQGKFQLRQKQTKSFNVLKTKLSATLMLVFPNFNWVLKVELDVSTLQIGAAWATKDIPSSILVKYYIIFNIIGLPSNKSCMLFSMLLTTKSTILFKKSSFTQQSLSLEVLKLLKKIEPQVFSLVHVLTWFTYVFHH